jgi:hypothetical protein
MSEHSHLLQVLIQPIYARLPAAKLQLPAHITVETLQEETQFWQQLPATLAAAQDARRNAAESSNGDQPESSSSGR